MWNPMIITTNYERAAKSSKGGKDCFQKLVSQEKMSSDLSSLSFYYEDEECDSDSLNFGEDDNDIFDVAIYDSEGEEICNFEEELFLDCYDRENIGNYVGEAARALESAFKEALANSRTTISTAEGMMKRLYGGLDSNQFGPEAWELDEEINSLEQEIAAIEEEKRRLQTTLPSPNNTTPTRSTSFEDLSSIPCSPSSRSVTPSPSLHSLVSDLPRDSPHSHSNSPHAPLSPLSSPTHEHSSGNESPCLHTSDDEDSKPSKQYITNSPNNTITTTSTPSTPSTPIIKRKRSSPKTKTISGRKPKLIDLEDETHHHHHHQQHHVIRHDVTPSKKINKRRKVNNSQKSSVDDIFRREQILKIQSTGTDDEDEEIDIL